MKLTQLFPITLVLSMGCILTGTTSKQPLLRVLGEITALGAISREILVKQHQLDANNQKQLTLLTKENTCLQTKLSDAQCEFNKLEKKVKTQDTCQRLYLSKINKLQHQQKVILGNLAQLQEKLAKKTTAKSENNQQIQHFSGGWNTPLPNPPLAKGSQCVGRVSRLEAPGVRVPDRAGGVLYSTELKSAVSQKPSVKSLPEPQISVTRVYIDGNNLNFALDSLQIEVDYNALRVELSRNATVTTFKYYTGVHSPMSEGQRHFLSYLEHLRYQVIGLPILPRLDTKNVKTVGDDVKIVVDMLGDVKQQDRVILVSGDGDFIPAIEEVQRRGAQVTVIAKKTMLSEQLSQVADDVVLLDDIQYEIAKYRKFNAA